LPNIYLENLGDEDRGMLLNEFIFDIIKVLGQEVKILIQRLDQNLLKQPIANQLEELS
jgi:hypothetical protein